MKKEHQNHRIVQIHLKLCDTARHYALTHGEISGRLQPTIWDTENYIKRNFCVDARPSRNNYDSKF